ncbi:MAG: Cell division protein FtsI [Peptidoglycan synthetase], partial [uncultured Solirubrobacteraceae bacterium]
ERADPQALRARPRALRRAGRDDELQQRHQRRGVPRQRAQQAPADRAGTGQARRDPRARRLAAGAFGQGRGRALPAPLSRRRAALLARAGLRLRADDRPRGPGALAQRRARGREGRDHVDRVRPQRRAQDRRQRRHEPRPRSAADRAAGAGRQARLGRRDRARDRQGPRHGQHAGLRSQCPARRQGLQPPQPREELAAVQPRDAGGLRAGLDDEGRDRRRGARQRQVHAAVDRAGQVADHRLGRAAEELLQRAVRRDRADDGADELRQHGLGAGCRGSRQRPHAGLHGALRLRRRPAAGLPRRADAPQRRVRRQEGRADLRRLAPRRHRPRRHRPGAPARDAAADGDGRRDRRQRRHADEAADRQPHRRQGRAHGAADQARGAAARHVGQVRRPAHPDDGRRRARGNRHRGGARRHRGRRQDRYRRAEHRAPHQPAVVRRAGAALAAEDRDRRDARERDRRPGRRRRGADRQAGHAGAAAM